MSLDPSPPSRPARHRWLAAAAGMAVAAGVARHLLFRALERKAFVPPRDETSSAATPDNSTQTVRHATFASGDRTLHAAFMAVADPEAPALMVCHGDNECLPDWEPVQAMLASAGIASYVFDYSGYGRSTGRPRVRWLRQDALAAYEQFIAATPQSRRRVVLGHSLGSGILLDVARRFDPQPDGYVIAAGFSSARLAAVQTGRIPAWAAWLLPDPWNNAARASKLERPLLVVHSRDDAVIVPPHAERVASAARHLHALVMLDALPHDAAILPQHLDTFWPPILRFMDAQSGNQATSSQRQRHAGHMLAD
ncbi:alpha/beta hydrolase [Cupriavidus necator]|uniref:alpha/beta hydrolase n=1 Tax=Cupriavidus necator TaxID=106590 RepID=UPI002787D2B0|nr:alpha/beta fold hydrolase [Cupriavidus necator]MDQ0138714.1 alpha-beta hydrolase superfamily lysophospholipase [Cupriavidus necator]